jgi:hypothetical protein
MSLCGFELNEGILDIGPKQAAFHSPTDKKHDFPLGGEKMGMCRG